MVHVEADAIAESAAPWTLSDEGRRSAFNITVRDRISRELRNRILLGTLAAGDRLDLDGLADEFGTSRTPVREACLGLAVDGLVALAPRSGITVVGITQRDLLDNFELMATLSGVAASWAAVRADADDIEAIGVRRDEVARAIESGGDTALANLLFHRQVNLASHSPRVIAALAQTARLFPERFFDEFPDQIPCSIREHEMLVDAVVRRDAERARAVTVEHFRQAAERLRSSMTGRG